MIARVAAVLLIMVLAPATWAQSIPVPAPIRPKPTPSRQVTMFGILAEPGGTFVDPKLKPIQPQLTKLFPNHGFRLLSAQSKRLKVGQAAIICKLGDGYVAGTELESVLDDEGNVRFRFALEKDGMAEFSTTVKTPPNQLFFCDKTLPDGSRLIVGLGGR